MDSNFSYSIKENDLPNSFNYDSTQGVKSEKDEEQISVEIKELDSYKNVLSFDFDESNESGLPEGRHDSANVDETHNLQQDEFKEDLDQQKPNMSEMRVHLVRVENSEDSISRGRYAAEHEWIKEQNDVFPVYVYRDEIDLDTLTSDKVTEKEIRALSHDKLVDLLLQAVERLKIYATQLISSKQRPQKDTVNSEECSFITSSSRKTGSCAGQMKSHVLYSRDNEEDDVESESVDGSASRHLEIDKTQYLTAAPKTVVKNSISRMKKATVLKSPQPLTSPSSKTPPKPNPSLRGVLGTKASARSARNKLGQKEQLNETTNQLRHSSGSFDSSTLKQTWVKVLKKLSSQLNQPRNLGVAVTKKTAGIPVPKASPGTFPCQMCRKVFKTKGAYLQHVQVFHSDKPYKCKQCNASFYYYHSYKVHMKSHNNERPQCNLCDRTYLKAEQLKHHNRIVHSKSAKKDCHICGKSFHYPSSLKAHLEEHDRQLPYPCKQCDKSFQTEEEHRTHMREHRLERNYSCEICGKQFKKAWSKKTHMILHTSEKPVFICDYCGQQFSTKGILKDHINIHTNTTPYTCKFCNKTFHYSSTMYHHINDKHRAPQTFLCNVCGKSFKKKTYCVRHAQRHHGFSEQVPCTMCDGLFKDKQSLRKHRDSIHLLKYLYRCTLCQKTGSRLDNMKTHLKSHRIDGIELNQAKHIVKEHLDETSFLVSAPGQRVRKSKKNKTETAQSDQTPRAVKPTQLSTQSGNQVLSTQLGELAVHEFEASIVAPPPSEIDPTL